MASKNTMQLYTPFLSLWGWIIHFDSIYSFCHGGSSLSFICQYMRGRTAFQEKKNTYIHTKPCVPFATHLLNTYSRFFAGAKSLFCIRLVLSDSVKQPLGKQARHRILRWVGVRAAVRCDAAWCGRFLQSKRQHYWSATSPQWAFQKSHPSLPPPHQ